MFPTKIVVTRGWLWCVPPGFTGPYYGYGVGLFVRSYEP